MTTFNASRVASDKNRSMSDKAMMNSNTTLCDSLRIIKCCDYNVNKEHLNDFRYVENKLKCDPNFTSPIKNFRDKIIFPTYTD